MFRLLLVIGLGIPSGLMAGDFSGRWAGTATNARSAAVPVYLTINQKDEFIFGDVMRGGAKTVPLSEAMVRDNELRFRIKEIGGQSTDFALTFVVSGHPLGDRQITLEGTATAAPQESSVILYPVSDNPGKDGIASAPVVIHKVQPRYTEQAREINAQGTVLRQVEIEQTGMISKDQIRVVRGLGYGLDEAAIECVSRWLFKPGFRNGYAVRTAVSIQVDFRR